MEQGVEWAGAGAGAGAAATAVGHAGGAVAQQFPIVSNIEETAANVLSRGPEELKCSSWSEYADVCLILASIAVAKSYQEHGMEFTEGLMRMDVQGRAAMFGSECLEWIEEAKHHKGFWVDHLAGQT